MKKIFLGVVAALFVLLGVGSGSVYAEDSVPANTLQLSPSGIRLDLVAGEVLEGNAEHCPTVLDEGCAVQVKNIGTESFRYRVYVSPYVVKGEGNELSFSEEASTSYTQISRWISIKGQDGNYAKEAQFTINPGETQIIRYRVSIPDDIPGGSQYAVIWAQIIGEGDKSGIETVGQVGSVISGRSLGNTNEAAEITEYDFTRFAFSGPLHANATVKNVGNTDFAIRYYYTAKTLFGKEIHSDEGVVAAYPDTEYHVGLDWEDDVPFVGIFQVEFKVRAAGEERTESHIVVVMPLVIILSFILLLTVIIVWIIIIIRKRKERKARKLV